MKQALKRVALFLDRYEFIKFGKNNKTLIFLILLMISGMVAGSICVGIVNIEFLHKIDFLFLNDLDVRFKSSHLDIFVSSFSSLFIFVLIIEMATLSCWGMIMIPFIVAFRGLSFGITAGYLYLIYGLKGIAFYILILLPGIFVSSIGIVLFSVESIKFSIKIANKIVPKSNTESLWNIFKLHIRKLGYVLFILLISSLLDMGFISMFSRFFEF